MTTTSPWLSGPVAGIPPLLQPVAHSLLDCIDDVQTIIPSLTDEQIWTRPGRGASIGFHVRHAIGSLDRLFTYARGESLDPGQLAVLKTEGIREDGPATGAELIAAFAAAVERALAQLRATDESALLAPREVGRAKLPSNVIGLLFHGAEHTQRHMAQVITTAKIIA